MGRIQSTRHSRFRHVMMAGLALLLAAPVSAGGEAGPISLRDQGFFWIGARPAPVTVTGPDRKPVAGTMIVGQMYVGFQLPAKKRHPYPLVLVHGGGGQSTDWMGTPDGRDGWLDYFLAAGFDVYVVDRPGFGRSPDSGSYGAPDGPPTTELIADLFTSHSKQYPGGGGATTREVAEHTASSERGATVSQAMLKENMAALLDRIGPAILVTASNGGPSGWLAIEARPALVKGVLGIETVGLTPEVLPLLTFSPAAAAGQKAPAAAGSAACPAQPAKAPSFKDKKILLVASPLSRFAPPVPCLVEQLRQLGADAKLARLTDYGIEGNGHFMNEELNNGVIAKKVLIPWLAGIK